MLQMHLKCYIRISKLKRFTLYMVWIFYIEFLTKLDFINHYLVLSISNVIVLFLSILIAILWIILYQKDKINLIILYASLFGFISLILHNIFQH